MKRHSLNDAINQLKNIKKKARTSFEYNKYQNNTLQYKYDNRTNKNNNTTQLIFIPTTPTKAINKNIVHAKSDSDEPDVIDPTIQDDTDIQPTNQSSSNIPKPVIPPRPPPTPPNNPKSTLQIHPPETKSTSTTPNPKNPDTTRSQNPRFSINPPATPPRPKTSEPHKRSPNRLSPHKKFRSPPSHRVQFDTKVKLTFNRHRINHYYQFGLRLLKDLTSQKRGAHYVKFAADKGHIEAIQRYALLLYEGSLNRPYVWRLTSPSRYVTNGIKRNRTEAARYYKMGADLGDIKSLHKYRDMLYEGDGIPQDKKTAASLYKIEADRGDLFSMSQYGTMLYLGDGVDKDLNGSAQYLRRAADAGDRFGARMYAYLCQTGSGVEKSVREAVKYYRVAAEMGDAVAAKQIVKLVESGKAGMCVDKKEADKYRKMVADHKDDACCKYK